MSAYIAYRVLKFIGLGLFGAKYFTKYLSSTRDRLRFGLGFTTVGWLSTWLAGWGLVKTSNVSMGASWVSAGMLFSMVAFVSAAAAVTSRGRAFTGLAAGAWAASVAVMGFKTWSLAHPVSVTVGLVVAIAAMAMVPETEAAEEVERASLKRWFGVVAKLEGVSLLTLFGVFMPAKYLLHLELDGGQGWFGWFHGMMVVGYVGALMLATLRFRWSLVDAVLGFLCSFVPLGTFWFERRMDAR